jgi:hypothetical protein
MTEPQYKWLPVTAADEWWKLPVEELRFEDYPVVHIWDSGEGENSILVAYADPDGVVFSNFVDKTDIDEEIARRVRVEPEKWRYFKNNDTPFLFRVRSTGTDEMHCSNGKWVKDGVPWTLDQFIKHRWIERDEHGNPLQQPQNTMTVAEAVEVVKAIATPPKPDRTIPSPLNAANFPAWAVWVKYEHGPSGVKNRFDVGFNGLEFANRRGVRWAVLQNGEWQLGDAAGNWYDVPKIGGGE